MNTKRKLDEMSSGSRTSFAAPLSFITSSRLEAMEFSLDKMLKAEFVSAQRVASAKSSFKYFSRDLSWAFLEPFDVSHEEFLERQRFLNENLLNIIALTDKHEDTIGHSQLVARYSLLMAAEYGIDDRAFLTDLERGALLHDIGKIGIPESILRKQGPLTEAERKVVEEHPFLGYELIEEYEFLKKAAQVVLYHHERYDGKGYPYGLRGEEISVEARIFALVDTLDAITSDRPYRKGQSFEKALEEIEKGSGTQFDPLLVDIMLSIPVESWRRVRMQPRTFTSSELTH